MEWEYCRQRYMRYLWVATSLKEHLSVQQQEFLSTLTTVEEREGCLGCHCRTLSGTQLTRTRLERLAQVSLPPPQQLKLSHKTASLFSRSRQSLTHLWETSSKCHCEQTCLGYLLPAEDSAKGEGRQHGAVCALPGCP